MCQELVGRSQTAANVRIQQHAQHESHPECTQREGGAPSEGDIGLALECEDAGVHVQLMLPSGKRKERRFKSTEGPNDVVKFGISSQDPRHFALFTAHPRQELERAADDTFASLGISGKIVLLLEKRK